MQPYRVGRLVQGFQVGLALLGLPAVRQVRVNPVVRFALVLQSLPGLRVLQLALLDPVHPRLQVGHYKLQQILLQPTTKATFQSGHLTENSRI